MLCCALIRSLRALEWLPAALLLAVLSSVALGPGRELLYPLLCCDCSLRALERLSALYSLLCCHLWPLGPVESCSILCCSLICSHRALERLPAALLLAVLSSVTPGLGRELPYALLCFDLKP